MHSKTAFVAHHYINPNGNPAANLHLFNFVSFGRVIGSFFD
jgi:hypothetical protein